MQLMEALIFLIRTVMGLYIMILLLRLLFQVVRADFYNPFSQMVVKLTSPLVMPLRRVIPPMGRIDSASLLLAIMFQVMLIFIVLGLKGVQVPALSYVIWAALGLVHRVIDLYTVALFLMVIISWVAPHSRNPVIGLAHQLTEPLLRPVRNAIPPMGGLDFSVMAVLMVLYVLGTFIIPGSPV